jgi:hypothetical protein
LEHDLLVFLSDNLRASFAIVWSQARLDIPSPSLVSHFLGTLDSEIAFLR